MTDIHPHGLHHVTAIASEPQRNVDFYTHVLGLRLVKQTVNFDAPETYHLYYGDEHGTPGTVMTYFPFPNIGTRGKGAGEVAETAFAVLPGTLPWWRERLAAAGVRDTAAGTRFGAERLAFTGPDGDELVLVGHRAVEQDVVDRRARSVSVDLPHQDLDLVGLHLLGEDV